MQLKERLRGLGAPQPLLYSSISNEIKRIATTALQNFPPRDLPPRPSPSSSPLSLSLPLVARRPPSPSSEILAEEEEQEQENSSNSGSSDDSLLLPRHRLPDTMPDIQLGACTLRSHGVKVAKFHVPDWIILLLLIIIDITLNVIEPFHRFVGKDMLTDLRYPLKDNTVPFWAVPLIAILLPFMIFIAIYIKKRNVYDLHQAILGTCTISGICTSTNFGVYNLIKHGTYDLQAGLLFSVIITAVLTDAIKDAVGRPRPDFFWRCFPDGKDVYDNVTTNVVCHGDKSVIKEGHKSFPSGHSSFSFAGLGFLAWYLSGKLRAFDHKGHIARLCIVLLPLLGATLVAISRVDDYWHHWQDVFVGGFLGLIVASFCYLQFFPPPYDANGWWPHAHFQAVADSCNNEQVGYATNSIILRPSETEAVYISSEGRGGVNTSDTCTVLDSMESGRRH